MRRPGIRRGAVRFPLGWTCRTALAGCSLGGRTVLTASWTVFGQPLALRCRVTVTSEGADMGFGDRWDGCMHTMGMPTPREAWHGAVEGIEKLHEIELALGGLGLAEAAEQLAAMGVVLEVGGEAA